MAGVKLPRRSERIRYMAWRPDPLIGRSLPVLASDWSMLPHLPCPASLWWGLVIQESNIRFMPQQQISMTLNFHNASSILAFCHVLFYLLLIFLVVDEQITKDLFTSYTSLFHPYGIFSNSLGGVRIYS